MNPYSWLQRNTVLVHMATLLKQFVVEKLGNKCTNWQSISFPFTATINNNSIKEYIYLSWLDLVLLYLLIVLHIRIFLIFIDKNWTYYTIGAGNETKHSCQKRCVISNIIENRKYQQIVCIFSTEYWTYWIPLKPIERWTVPFKVF